MIRSKVKANFGRREWLCAENEEVQGCSDDDNPKHSIVDCPIVPSACKLFLSCILKYIKDPIKKYRNRKSKMHFIPVLLKVCRICRNHAPHTWGIYNENYNGKKKIRWILGFSIIRYSNGAKMLTNNALLAFKFQ